MIAVVWVCAAILSVAAAMLILRVTLGPTVLDRTIALDTLVAVIVCALALEVAGVEREAVVADYALTAERIDDVVGKLAARPTYAQDMARRDVASHTPRADSMRRLLDLLDADHGGAAGWLAERGFGPEEQTALRLRLTEA